MPTIELGPLEAEVLDGILNDAAAIALEVDTGHVAAEQDHTIERLLCISIVKKQMERTSCVGSV